MFLNAPSFFSSMGTTILDCYTDEASGLGVPPYLGTYPRYIAGAEDGKVTYLTIDDLRLYKRYHMQIKRTPKTNIRVYNLTKNIKKIKEILDNTDKLIVSGGVHVPGKYLSAVPGTLHEITELVEDIHCEKILTGPAYYGSRLEGGKTAEKEDLRCFDKIQPLRFSYDQIKEYAIKGATIVQQIPDLRIIEIESGAGCFVSKACGFCTEKLKSPLLFRDNEDILEEIKTLYGLGGRYFRLGKETCIYSHPDIVDLLMRIRKACRDIKVLHIDNVNPKKVVWDKDAKITKGMVKYCTPGNIAAFGVESFDPVVFRENTLNTTAQQAYDAIKKIHKYGSERGANGMPKFLAGINIIHGLRGESKKTHEENMKWLKKIYNDGLIIRRINIRQVAILPGTDMDKYTGIKYIKKNKKYYWKWTNEIRQMIDYPMLERVVPKGTIMKDVRMEIYDGNTTFGRHIGTYPLVVGVKQKYPLGKFYTVKVVDHMLRSIVAEVVKQQ